MAGQRIGHVRVSSWEKNAQHQLDAIPDYSIISTAWPNGMEPYAYLRQLFAETGEGKVP